MATHVDPASEARAPLTKERVLQAAVELADQGGIDSLSMRKLAQALGVEAMSLYNHVRNKEDVLDGIVDVVVAEIDVTSDAADWKSSMRQQVIAARQVLLRHPWAPRVIESRTTMSPATMRYMESVIGILRLGGFSVDQTHHALHVLGSRVLGFTQDLYDDGSEVDASPEMAALLAREMADQYPYITEMALAVSHEGGLGGCDDDVEFDFGLDLILDGLERLRNPRTRPRRREPQPQLVGDLDPLVVRAIDNLRSAATRASDGTLDQQLRRQMRDTFVEVLDSVLEEPARRAARRAALARRRKPSKSS